MKKIYLFIAILVISLSVDAQELSKNGSNFKGGIRLGLTTSQISGDDLSGFNKLGAYAGGFTNFPISKTGYWNIQMEMNFIMKGSSTPPRKPNNPHFYNVYTLNLFYTETPFLVKCLLFKGFEVEAGPSINFLFASTEKGPGGSNIKGRPFRIFELSIIAGISYTFKEHWGISARYSNSIIPVRIPTWVYNRLVSKQFNSTLAFSVFYQF